MRSSLQPGADPDALSGLHILLTGDMLHTRAWVLHMQSQDDANVKTGDGRTMHARTTLARILKDSAFIAAVPIAQRLSPCSLATAALAGLSLP